MYGNRRILTLKEAARLSRRLKARGKRIATTNGCFDLLHRGHLALLKTARRRGQVVIVGLNSDRSVRSYKGDRRPIRSQRERAELLLDLPWVDYVAVFHQQDSLAFVKAVKPRFHINDSDYGSHCIERGPVEAGGGRIVVVPKVRCASTTEVIRRIVEKYGSRRSAARASRA